MKVAILLLTGGIVSRGAENAMEQLAEDLVSLNTQVTIFQLGEANGQKPYQTTQIQIPFVPNSHKPTSFIGKIFERMYVNNRGLATLLFTLKVVPHVHKYDIIIPVDGFWEILILKLLRKLYKKTYRIVTIGMAGIGWTDTHTLKLKPDMFIALSPTALSWAQQIAPTVKLKLIPLQVDRAQFSHIKPHQIPLHRPIILTVAALTAYKRIPLVIKAVAQIKNASLIIIGQGEQEEYLKTLCHQYLPHRFLLTSTPFHELPSWYAASDVFTLASESQEAFGRVLIEAQASGLPIVTTDDPVRRWLVGNQGIFTNPEDINAYAEALKQAIRLPKNFQNQNSARFDRQKIAREYKHMFEEMMPQVCETIRE